MQRQLALLLSMGFMTFGAFSSGTSYQLNSYSLGSGGTNSASSSSYNLQGNTGEQTNGTTTGSGKTADIGAIQTEQINVPGTPTLDTGGGTYYNKLGLMLDTSSNPTDTTYSVAISTDNFATVTNYVQADGTIGASRVYQIYTAWGGGSGTFIVGLLPSTTYYVKVDAMQGLFTNTEYSAVASASTASPTLSFSVSPNSSTLTGILPVAITTSANISFTFATNGVSGGNIYVRGANAGLTSPSQSYTIPTVSADLSTQPQGFGLQGTSPSQTSGGPLSAVAPFNGSGHTVGAESTSFQQLFTSPAAVAGGTAAANVQIKPLGSAPAASDYNETFTFIASASF